MLPHREWRQATCSLDLNPNAEVDRALMDIHNRTSFILCLIGGGLLIASAASGTIGMLGEIVDGLSQLFGPHFVMTFAIVMGILGVLTLFGGIGVIIAGFVLTTRRIELGRNMILISVGTGVLGLAMSLVQLIIAGNPMMEPSSQIAQIPGWVGAILSVEARIIAEQKPMSS